MWNCRLLQLGKGLQYLQERMGKNFKRYESDTKEKRTGRRGELFVTSLRYGTCTAGCTGFGKGRATHVQKQTGANLHAFSGRRTL